MAKLTGIAFALLAVIWLAQTAMAAPDTKEKQEPQPSFKPGASVTLKLELKAPDGWHLNYLAPVTISFDKEKLKDAPFTVKQTVFSYKFDEYKKSFTAEVPIQLSDSLKDGLVDVPLQLDLSMCEKASELCTFISDDKTVQVQVMRKAPKDSKNQALDKGDLAIPLLLHAL